jgi:hypothetical protein
MPHLDTHSAHSSSVQVLKEATVTNCQKKEERGRHILGRGISLLFSSLSWHALAIYIKEVLLGFLPHEGFPG